jgi:amidase
LQPAEAWLTFRGWIDAANPRFQFSVARNLALAASIPESERGWAALVREEARGRMRQLLPAGTVLCLPTTPFPAPRCGLPLSERDPLSNRITCLCAHGGLTGVPQVSIPGATVGDFPVGLSIVGAPGSDALLVRVAQALNA